MELGPFQEAWLKSLEEHPERQMKGLLAKMNDDSSYGACCLGEALIVYCNMFEKPLLFENNYLFSKTSFYILEDYQELGFSCTSGDFVKTVTYKDVSYSNLAQMNDGGVTWPEIAAVVRANPDNVFTKSI